MGSEKDVVLVVSAHAADFVWRAGGAIALYASRSCRVRVLCLSFGERGESERLWKEPGMTLEQVKTVRRGRPSGPQKSSARRYVSSMLETILFGQQTR